MRASPRSFARPEPRPRANCEVASQLGLRRGRRISSQSAGQKPRGQYIGYNLKIIDMQAAIALS